MKKNKKGAGGEADLYENDHSCSDVNEDNGNCYGAMKLYLIERTEIVPNPWDQYHGFVIRASNEIKAREYAAENSGCEGPDTWLDSNRSSCVRLLEDGECGIVFYDYFCAG